MTPLERDLTKRINEKHQQWISDAFDLFEMAGLKPSAAARAISMVLTHAIIVLLSAAEDPDLDEFSRIIKLEVDRSRSVKEKK